jgi:hypothetical protein
VFSHAGAWLRCCSFGHFGRFLAGEGGFCHRIAFMAQVGLLSCSCKLRVVRTQLLGMPGRLEAS